MNKFARISDKVRIIAISHIFLLKLSFANTLHVSNISWSFRNNVYEEEPVYFCFIKIMRNIRDYNRLWIMAENRRIPCTLDGYLNVSCSAKSTVIEGPLSQFSISLIREINIGTRALLDIIEMA
jgi:hypothetical protein